MLLAKTLSFYKRKDVQDEIVRQAQDKEVAFRFEKGFGKRPDILAYPNDVLELAKDGMVSLHCSEELWNNPLSLRPSLGRKEMDDLRKGWDLIIDVDCPFFEYSKLAAHFIVQFLKRYKVKSISAKFSGNKGFHVAVPWDAFPKQVGNEMVKNLFPEVPQKIALLIKESIKKPMANAVTKLEKGDLNNIVKKINNPSIINYENTKSGKVPVLNLEPVIAIDTILITSRHLYRMPYSFHEKSGLISVPVDVDKILSFSKESARPENVVVNHEFLKRKDVVEGEAALLFREALDFKHSEKKEKRKFSEPLIDPDTLAQEVPLDMFPPSILKILEGLEDGRKRALFVLLAFFSSIGWTYEKIEKTVREWNKRNKEPLRENYLVGQLRYYKGSKVKKLPPNYDNKNYYHDIGVYCREMEEFGIRNPVQYVRKRLKAKK